MDYLDKWLVYKNTKYIFLKQTSKYMKMLAGWFAHNSNTFKISIAKLNRIIA